MKNKKAFPRPDSFNTHDQDGMDTREYFAAKIMAVLIRSNLTEGLAVSPSELARDACINADALIEELEK